MPFPLSCIVWAFSPSLVLTCGNSNPSWNQLFFPSWLTPGQWNVIGLKKKSHNWAAWSYFKFMVTNLKLALHPVEKCWNISVGNPLSQSLGRYVISSFFKPSINNTTLPTLSQWPRVQQGRPSPLPSLFKPTSRLLSLPHRMQHDACLLVPGQIPPVSQIIPAPSSSSGTAVFYPSASYVISLLSFVLLPIPLKNTLISHILKKKVPWFHILCLPCLAFILFFCYLL